MLGLGTVGMIAALYLAPEPASASASSGVTLHWEAPATCPAAPTVQGWLARALADSTAAPQAIEAWARVQPAQSAEGFVLELRVLRPDAPEGRRTLEGHDCHELARAAVSPATAPSLRILMNSCPLIGASMAICWMTCGPMTSWSVTGLSPV